MCIRDSWLNRLWHLVLEGYDPGEAVGAEARAEAERALARITHQTTRKVTGDLERIRFNVMISALMEFTNYLAKVKEAGSVGKDAWAGSIRTLLLLLAPTAPHLAEELWQRLGYDYSIHNQRWPEWDEALAKDEEVTLVLQVNGKLRDRITVPVSITEEEAKELARGSKKVQLYLEDKRIIREIYVPGKLLNIVVK